MQLSGKLAHTVVFWLKEAENPAVLETFRSELQILVDNIEDVCEWHIGSPASTRRPVIDASYTFTLLVTFEDMTAHDRYQEHPVHKQFVENTKPMWEKVLIYDAIN